MRRFGLLQPSTADEAVALLGEHGEDARLIAGGAMLTILLRERLITGHRGGRATAVSDRVPR